MTEGLPREWMRGPQWATPEARREWEPVIASARAAWVELELVSVSAGARPSALVRLTPEEVPVATLDAARQGLMVVPLGHRDGHTLAAVTKPSKFSAWLEAYPGCDDDAVGELLGFPACCRAHFAKTWTRGLTDTVTTITSRDPKKLNSDVLLVDGPPEANLLLRHLGVRLVPHLPCSPTCAATVLIGQDLAEVGAKAELDVLALYRLLDLPVTYSALHGVAVIETPHFRLWAGTDYTPEEVRVTRAETKTPALEGVSGAHIPAGPGSTPGPATTWKDNGFGTRDAMDHAHDVVLEAVRPFSAEVNSALDLGCGDGRLLTKIADDREGRWVGVEADEGRATRGTDRGEGNVEVLHGTIEEWAPKFGLGKPFDVALLMPGRLLEMDAADADRVRAALPGLADRLVVYAYGDTLREHDGLGSLAQKAGLRVTGHVYLGVSVEAAEAEVTK